MVWIACIIGAYLLGSIPFGVLIGRAKGVNIREHGSRNIGATNVGRVLGRKFGYLCFILDMTKGAIPVLVAGLLSDVIGRNPMELGGGDLWLWMFVAIAALLGHMYSVFLGFGGGKGVATAFGALVAMWPVLTIPALIALAAWIIVVMSTRVISLASMTAAAIVPLATLISLFIADGDASDTVGTSARLINASAPLTVTIAIAVLVLWRHRSNIRRLLRGEEHVVKSST
ncbi:MAG: glycerol-3-phosphate 1-O-acyltransferase PlsY [Phycisphaerales bacterium]|nr:glycerol-3-phosphate 1-O-acyltransferase PlsY [Phycisphaerales bacterium]